MNVNWSNLLTPEMLFVLLAVLFVAFLLYLAVKARGTGANVEWPVIEPTRPVTPAVEQSGLSTWLFLLAIALLALIGWVGYRTLEKPVSTTSSDTDAESKLTAYKDALKKGGLTDDVSKLEAEAKRVKKAADDHAKLTEVLKEAKLPDDDVGKLKEKLASTAKAEAKLGKIEKVLTDNKLTTDADKLDAAIKFATPTAPVVKSGSVPMKTPAVARAEEIDEAKKKMIALAEKAHKAGFLRSVDELPLVAITFPVHDKLVGPLMMAEMKKGLRPDTEMKIKNITVFATQGHTIDAFYVTYTPICKGVTLPDETKVFTGRTKYTPKTTAEWADRAGLMMDLGRIGRSITPEDPPAIEPPSAKEYLPLFELPLP